LAAIVPMNLDRRDPPRLLIVVRDRFPPFRVDLTELFSRWLAPRFDLDWVMRREAEGRAAVLADAMGERFLVSPPGTLPWLTLQLRQAVRAASGEVDLVQVRDAALSAALFLVAARIGRRPFVYWMSYPMAEGYLHRARRSTPKTPLWLTGGRLAYGTAASVLLYRWVLPGADHVFVQSERMKADVAAYGLPPDRITPVPMGVSVSVYDPRRIAPADDPRLDGRKTLVYVGSLDPERNISMLVQALALTVRGGFDAVLVLVGAVRTRQRAELEGAAKANGVAERLLFTDHGPLTEALAYVRRADVCLAPFPVRPETYLSATPTKLVEYLAMGRPVVASDHPDQRRVIEESRAGVIAPRTAEGFAAAISALLADPERAEVIGARGPAWVAAHRDYAAISGTVARVFDDLLGRAGP
jgi:glycosyltransferase involved in cell wall biosynthesis